ncbi:hypothetical protein [Candidatus Magnetobacterium casense]|uniref:Uncharacterized protein n=1 Tax=Candidatus Magnetobacterium casense TaxID=1455061 RepID=A0ABS6RWT4_9BACT|nr:hypothetical protein [Candidatus Magnetobacterium casensis]MBV6341085.1 hypothetical protein [Candidatus Magnetobacterium casensis]
MKSWADYSRGYNNPNSGGAMGGMGGGGANPTQNQTPSWEILQRIFGGLQSGDQDYRKWMSNLLNTMGSTARGQLAGGIGSQLGRMNVSIPSGAGVLANRYMGSMGDQMEMIKKLIDQPSPYAQNLSQALSLGQGLMPTYQRGGNNSLEELMKLLNLTGQSGRQTRRW